MMESRKKERSVEKCSEEESNHAEMETICPLQDQKNETTHCRSDCEWFSLDSCVIWDFIRLLRSDSPDQKSSQGG